MRDAIANLITAMLHYTKGKCQHCPLKRKHVLFASKLCLYQLPALALIGLLWICCNVEHAAELLLFIGGLAFFSFLLNFDP